MTAPLHGMVNRLMSIDTSRTTPDQRATHCPTRSNAPSQEHPGTFNPEPTSAGKLAPMTSSMWPEKPERPTS
jgi:hypothetical protein